MTPETQFPPIHQETTNYELWNIPRGGPTTNQNMRNEPNSRTAGVSPASQSPKMRNEPNFAPARPKIRKTNPIPQTQQPKNTKRTQSTARPHPQTRETNPIYVPRHPPTSLPIPQLHETNPIPAYQRVPTHPKYAKRTQFPHPRVIPPVLPSSHYGKQTQSTLPPPSRHPPRPAITKNEPNLPPPTPSPRVVRPTLHATNPISIPLASSRPRHNPLRETNPISIPLASPRLSNPPLPETNPIPAGFEFRSFQFRICFGFRHSNFGFPPDLSACNCAKRTQSPNAPATVTACR